MGSALALACGAAVLHAVWSLVSKRLAGYDAVAFVWLASLGSFVAYAPLVLALVGGEHGSGGTAGGGGWRLTPVQLAFVAGSVVINLGYFLVIQYGYRLGGLSLVYPIARGTGPILAIVGGILFLGEVPSGPGLFGALAAVGGVVALGLSARPADGGPPPAGGYGRALGYALLSGLTIAGYTLWDQHTVGPLAVSPLLLNWVDDLGRVVLLGPSAYRRRAALGRLWRECRLLILGAATLMPLPYLLFLFALRLAPAAVVSPIREASVLLVVLLGGTLLAEGHLRARLLAAGVIVTGLGLIAFG
ncbi:EamA family transporter [Kitasatospora sp. NPDC096147]|uniref:EamA family transporter n=1 Tax=Kitasatospora sp. NPDC096147 TaxID=3364093 RepID=UPI0037FAEE74